MTVQDTFFKYTPTVVWGGIDGFVKYKHVSMHCGSELRDGGKEGNDSDSGNLPFIRNATFNEEINLEYISW